MLSIWLKCRLPEQKVYFLQLSSQSSLKFWKRYTNEKHKDGFKNTHLVLGRKGLNSISIICSSVNMEVTGAWCAYD